MLNTLLTTMHLRRQSMDPIMPLNSLVLAPRILTIKQLLHTTMLLLDHLAAAAAHDRVGISHCNAANAAAHTHAPPQLVNGHTVAANNHFNAAAGHRATAASHTPSNAHH